MSKVLASEELYGTYIQHIVNLIEQYGQVDGDHHLRWVIDQIARVVWGGRYDGGGGGFLSRGQRPRHH